MVRYKCQLHFSWFGGNQTTTHPTVTFFNKHKRDQLKIQTHSEISRFVIYKEACLTRWRISCTKPLKNLTFSDDNSDSDRGHGQQEGEQSDCDRTFYANYSPPEPHWLIHGDLKSLVYDLNLSKKTSSSLRFLTKRVETSAPTYWLLCSWVPFHCVVKTNYMLLNHLTQHK
jgi:hypothetical protein